MRRPRLGRPPEFKQRVTLSVFLEADERQALYAAAEGEGISASGLARRFIVAGLTQRRVPRRWRGA